MDSNYQFEGVVGFLLALVMVLLSPIVLSWGAAMEVMRVLENEENRMLTPKEKTCFYVLGVYAALMSATGIVAMIYGLVRLVMLLGEMMS